MQEDFKPETEIWAKKKQSARKIAMMITYLVEILTIPLHRVARLNILKVIALHMKTKQKTYDMKIYEIKQPEEVQK